MSFDTVDETKVIVIFVSVPVFVYARILSHAVNTLTVTVPLAVVANVCTVPALLKNSTLETTPAAHSTLYTPTSNGEIA